MASMNELKAVHMPSESHREFRSLVKYRKTLDSRICKMKCTIRAWFVNHGITIDSGEKAWCTGRELINSFRKTLADCELNELWRGELDIELTQLDSLTNILDGVVQKLEKIGKDDTRIARLRTIPGVGPRTAEILVACIDDAKRFKNGRQVSQYFGLVPRQYQSGETDRNGRITKRGNPLARTILVECAWASLRYNPWAKDAYDRICGKQKTRKKKAAIALARKIAVLAWAMLRDEKDWEPKRMIEITESYGRISLGLKEKLLNMPPKECRHKRKNRRISEERAAKRVAALKEKPELSTSKPAATSKPSKGSAPSDTCAIGTRETASASASLAQNPKPPGKDPKKPRKVKTAEQPNPKQLPKPRQSRKLETVG
jgi:transposase